MAKEIVARVTFKEILEAWSDAVVEANRIIEDFEELLNEAGVYLADGEGSLANQLEMWRSRVTDLGAPDMPTDGTR